MLKDETTIQKNVPIHSSNALVLPVLLFTLTLTLYWVTLAPGIIWGDSAKLTLYAFSKSPNWKDFVGGHPLHTLVSILFASALQFDEYAKAVNIVSSIFGAMTILLTFKVIKKLTNEIFPALVGATSLALSHTFWSLSVVAESYTLVVCFAAMTLNLIIAADDAKSKHIYYYLAGLTVTLSTLSNLLLVFAFPGYLFLVAKRDPSHLRNLFLGIASGLLILFTAAHFSGALQNFQATIGGATQSYITPSRFVKSALLSVLCIAYQFPSPVLLLLVPSFFSKANSDVTISLFISTLGCIAFAAVYQYQRSFVLLVMAYFHIAVLIGLASSHLSRSIAYKSVFLIVSVCSPLATYFVAPKVVGELGLLSARPLPGRSLDYFYRPWKQNVTRPAEWAIEFLGGTNTNSLIFADFTLSRVLKYIKETKGLNSSGTIVEIDNWIANNEGKEAYLKAIQDTHLEGRHVFIAQDFEPYYKIEELARMYQLIPYLGGFKILPKNTRPKIEPPTLQ